MNTTTVSTVRGQSDAATIDHPALQPLVRSSSLLKPRATARPKERNLGPRRTSILCGLLALTALGVGSAARANSIYVSSNMTFNGRGTMDGANYNSVGTRGIFFTTGPSGPFTINLIDTVFMTDPGVASGDTLTFKLDVRNVSGGLPGTTLFATDTVTWQSTSAPGIDQTVNLRQADLPNISSYVFQSSSVYSLVLYSMEQLGSPNNKVSMRRNGSLGAASTVSYTDGFSNAGFFQNNFTYTGSHAISVGAVPEPSTWALAVLGSLFLAALGRRNLRRHRVPCNS